MRFQLINCTLLLLMSLPGTSFAQQLDNAPVSFKDFAKLRANSNFSQNSYPTPFDSSSRQITFNDDLPIFTDPTPAVSGLTGRGNTVGEQRRNATLAATSIIESQLRFTQPVHIEFSTSDLNCNSFGVGTYNRSFVNGPDQIPNTIYPIALASQLGQTDRTPDGTADVLVILNSNILFGQCERAYNYSLIAKSFPFTNSIDYIDLVLHEISHGLGFEIRPPGAQLPFVFEQFLFAKDEGTVFGLLNNEARAAAAEKVKNVVFTGTLTNDQARRTLRPRTALSINDSGVELEFDVNEVVGTPPVRGQGIRAALVNLDFNTCEPQGNLFGKIVVMASGCAREELGFDGTRFGGIELAQRRGARAVIIDSGNTSFRQSIFTSIRIPVASVLFSEYRTLEALAANGTQARLFADFRNSGGTDEQGRPYVFTGPNVPIGVEILHFDPSISVRARTGKTTRALQEPIISRTSQEPVSRSLGFNIPALIDIGWAAPNCGNLRVERYEQCDDGNMISGDGCEQNCLLPKN